MKYIDKMLIASGVALLLSGGVAAAALNPSAADAVIAQLPGDVAVFAANGPFGSHNILATAATYIGISEADLRTELATGKTLAEIAVAHGKTRDGLIAALTDAAKTEITTLVDQQGNTFGPGPGGRGMHVDLGSSIATAATYLGTTEADLRTKLQSGQTLAQIAAATPGKTRDGLIAAIVAAQTANIDAAQAAGTITADQATQMKANLTARVTAEVDSTRPFGPGFGFGRGPHR